MKQAIEDMNWATDFFRQLANDGRFSQELNSKITDESVRLKADNASIKTDISGAASLHRVLKPTTEEVPGISDFNKGQLAKNRGFAYNKVGVRYAVGDPDAMGDSVFDTDLIPQLWNAKLVVSQKGRELLNVPVSQLTYNSEDELKELSVPGYFIDGQEIEIYYQFPDGSTVPAADENGSHLSMIEFIGVSAS